MQEACFLHMPETCFLHVLETCSLQKCRKHVSYTCTYWKHASCKSAGKLPTKCTCELSFNSFPCNVEEACFLQKCRKTSYKMYLLARLYCFTCNVQETCFLQKCRNFLQVFLVQICRKFSYTQVQNAAQVQEISGTYCKNLEFLVKCWKHYSCTSTSKYRYT